MFLHQLIDDVLLHIVSDLASDIWSGKQDLFNLSLTCHALSNFARPAIPRNVVLGIPSRRFELFNRSLEEEPAYGHRVVFLRRGLTDINRLPLNEAQLHVFLQRLPNLQSFSS
ncbi:hypothetical protein NA56DRAFT_126216 [Hyaloscypha hepaticicola]|uniref:F-box domain-containing protein n=1 Tax=Hyaloscypha hepaticicola TaxID=2082293 RepID=A0A2J6Q537_9HELO|nr:hypothetical protein NA56DRAFT_126216 [Hyaloscypha hepaticicola]